VISIGGTAVGLGVGWIAGRGRRRIGGGAAEVALGLAAAFASYETAQAVGFSGVLAAVACGLYVGRRGGAGAAEPFWEGLGHLLESILFLLIGLQFLVVVRGLPGSTAWTPIGEAGAVLGAAVVVRFLWMSTVGRVLSRVGRTLPAHVERLGRAELGVLGFCGMRGALSLAGALSIPLLAAGRPFVGRDEVIFLVYAVVLGTLIVPSLTLERLVRRLGLARAPRLGPEHR
jgi:CPA1 family monovalent cation:H+ antiporter